MSRSAARKKRGSSGCGCLLLALVSAYVLGHSPVCSYSPSQGLRILSDFRDNEPYVSKGESPIDPEVAAAARNVTARARTEGEKARTLFDWVAKNIEYDAAAIFLEDGDKPDQSAAAVLKRHNGVCQGYSNVYRDMARAVGLECEVVTGITRERKDYGSPIKLDRRHSWNAVSVDGRWLLLDTTWGSGVCDIGAKTFRYDYNPEWFDVAPLEMLYSHLPTDSRWQLTKPGPPISENQFNELAHAFHPYFQFGMRPVSHPNPKITANDYLDLEFTAEKDMEVVAVLKRDEKDLDKRYANVWNEGKSSHVHLSFPEAGNYDLWIQVGTPGKQDSRSALVYDVVAKGGGQPLPRLEGPAYKAGLKLTSHPYSNFEVGDRLKLQFSTESPLEAAVGLVKDGKPLKYHTLVSRKGHAYRVEATFPEPGEYEVDLFLSRPGDQKKEFAASYQVISRGGVEPLPILYNTRWNVDAVLPMRPLRKGQTEELRLTIPKARVVWAELGGGERVYFQAVGDVFSARLTPKVSKDVHVFAGFTERDATSAVTFQVQNER